MAKLRYKELRRTVLSSLLFISVAASASAQAKVDPLVLTATEHGKNAEFLVILKEKADLSPSVTLTSRADRKRFVHAVLREHSKRTQQSLRDLLQSRGGFHRSFHVVNAILARGDRALVEELALRPDVARIEANPKIHNDLPQPLTDHPDAPLAVETNVQVTGAPSLWTEGFTGQGIVVGGQDTGYRWTHNAIKSQYRGWNGTTASHDYNWHDSVGSCTEPCDPHGHGTHTMGTAAGDDGSGNQIGMAPGAKWIGCRNMDASGNGTPATYLECFEFLLAPYPVGGTPDDGDPSLAPDVTVNSWGCPASEGCSALTLQEAVNAQKAAGIMTVAAAGNSGPACGTVNDPPPIYDASYTVGGTTVEDSMYFSSSRGPGDETGLMKPDIVAPAVSIRSAANSSDSGYTFMTGTSMAAPSVAGAVALLWSALPELKNDQDATESVLNQSAVDLPSIVELCGGNYVTGPNNTWGHGRLDVANAYANVCKPDVASGLSLQAVGQDRIDISWNASQAATSYEVHRGEGTCPGTTVAPVGTTSGTEFSDTPVLPNTSYSYYVKALRNDCEAALSTCVDTTILSCLFCDDFENGQQPLNWDFIKGDWTESAGVLKGTPLQRKALAVADPAFPGCRDCSIRTVLSLSSGDAARAGIFGWYQDKRNNIELVMNEATDKWVLKQRVDGSVVEKSKEFAPIVAGVYYTIVLWFDGAMFHLEVDGNPLLSLTPVAAVPSGTVGLHSRVVATSFESIEVFPQ